MVGDLLDEWDLRRDFQVHHQIHAVVDLKKSGDHFRGKHFQELVPIDLARRSVLVLDLEGFS